MPLICAFGVKFELNSLTEPEFDVIVLFKTMRLLISMSYQAGSPLFLSILKPSTVTGH